MEQVICFPTDQELAELALFRAMIDGFYACAEQDALYENKAWYQAEGEVYV